MIVVFNMLIVVKLTEENTSLILVKDNWKSPYFSEKEYVASEFSHISLVIV